ncbi:MAG: efflux RND transporter periplasmic adaptor subunit [Acidobacteria bacterium]|nr:efflux RND transporter periplasmic adaptor subunit [Acidobacteriota bacterium]
MKLALKIGLPVLVLALGAYVALLIIRAKPEPEQRPPTISLPLVHVMEVKPESRRLTVHAEGTVAPRTTSQLTSEVSGRVVWVSPSLVAGGFFNAEEVLLRIDSRVYRLGVVRARAAVAQARLKLATEEQEAALARQEWENLGSGPPTSLVLREPQINEAKASLAAAEAALEHAEYDLERTEVKAPYDGRVWSETVDVGQFIAPGAALARLYGVDFAEVRLPIPDDELAYLRLPLAYRGQTQAAEGPTVVLSAEFAGKRHRWSGRILRTEGEIDPRTRMVHAVAEVKDPYGRGSDRSRPPLAVGMFVEAEIRGKWVSDVVVLPRSVLRGDHVLVVDETDRLYYRTVEILRAERDQVLIASGLSEGERVCVSVVQTPVDGMRVEVVDDSVADRDPA